MKKFFLQNVQNSACADVVSGPGCRYQLYQVLRIFVFPVLFCFMFICLMAEEPTEIQKGLASENFRLGVQAYYRGAFNDSIMAFEKALSNLPEESLILDWLGKAYYRSGFEDTALQQWQTALKKGYGGLLLENRIDIVRGRRENISIMNEQKRYVEGGNFPAKTGETVNYQYPTSVFSLKDGSSIVVSYGTNEIISYNVNGKVNFRSQGPLSGFLRPFDVYVLDNGDILVSEYGGDRVSVLDSGGIYKTSFGEKGMGDGQFMGPQYITVDSKNYVYVTDFGNNRVNVFNPEYQFVFSFGEKNSNFAGFTAVGGICCLDDLIYVGDGGSGALYCFDVNGNYIETAAPKKTFKKPEGIREWKGKLLVSDYNKMVLFDPVSMELTQVGTVGKASTSLMSSSPDVNGNILTAEFRENDVKIFSGMTDIAGGLFVQIERVNSEKFPLVQMEVRVEDRFRNPIVGLEASNFYVTEEKRPVSEQTLAGAAYQSSVVDITVILDRSLESEEYEESMKEAVKEIAKAMGGRGRLNVVSAGEIPSLEFSGSPDLALNFTSKNILSQRTQRWNLDLALRLGANNLVNGEKKRGVIFLSCGGLTPLSFQRYGLADIAAYLNNNGIIFDAVYLTRKGSVPELEYLCRQTGGKEHYIYEKQGLSPIVQELQDAPNGSYVITYYSALPPGFGESYLPVELEAYLLNRSGRDETGYFAPLQ